MKRTVVLMLILGGILLSIPAPADTVVEEIIARINNDIITRAELAHARDQLKQEVQQQAPQNADKLYAERQRDILRDLIDQQLLLQKGKDLGITGDTELIKRLDDIEAEVNKMKMPLAYAEQFYVLRDHINFVRDRYSNNAGN